MRSFSQFLVESFDKTYPYEKTKSSVAYVKAQYQFQIGSSDFVVQYHTAKDLGPAVSNIRVGRFPGKKFSQKIMGVTNFKMFVSTIANIIKEQAEQKDTAVKYTKGLSVKLDAEMFDKMGPLALKVLRLMLRGKYQVVKGFHDHPSDDTVKMIYMYRQGMKFEQVYKTLIAAMPAEEIAAIDLAAKEAESQAIAEPTFASGEPVTKASPTNGNSDGFQAGFYWTAGKKSLAYIKPDGAGRYEARVLAHTKTIVRLVNQPYEIVDQLLGPEREKLDIISPGKWPTALWHSNKAKNGEGVVCYSLADEPGVVFMFDGNVLVTEDYLTAMSRWECLPSCKGIPYDDTDMAMLVRKGNVSKFKYDDAQNKEFSVDGANSKKTSPVYLMPITAGLATNMLNFKYTNEPGVLMLLKTIADIKDEPPVAEVSPSSIEYANRAVPLPWQSGDIANCPRAEDRYPEINDKLRSLNVAFDGSRENQITIGEVININLHGSLVEMRATFDKLREATGADAGKLKRMVQAYLNKKDMDADEVTYMIYEKVHKGKFQGSKSALGSYTGNSYYQINSYLRGRSVGGGENNVKNVIDRLDKAFKKHGIRLPKDTVVYRGQSIPDAERDALLAGQEIVVPSYFSTSFRMRLAANFIKRYSSVVFDWVQPDISDQQPYSMEELEGNKRSQMLMSIDGTHRIPVIVPGSHSSHQSESEVILPRGTKMKLKNAADMVEIRPRTYLAHLTITGLAGVDDVLMEMQTPILKGFRQFCESRGEMDLIVKEMAATTMLLDLVDDDPMTDGERENMFVYYEKMLEEPLDAE